MDRCKKILFLTTVFPYPLDNGGKIRAFNNIKSLSNKYGVDLVCFAEEEVKEEYLEEMKKYCNEIRIVKKIFSNSLSKKITIKNILLSIIKNTPLIIEKFKDKRFKDNIEELLKKHKYETVFFEHLSITYYRKLFNRNFKLILSQQNCEYNLMKRRYKETENIFKRWYTFFEYIKLKKYEVNTCRHFENVIVLSEEDKKGLNFSGDMQKNISIIPIAVSNRGFVKKINSIKPIKNILFMGTMSWYPNEQGILWFINNVWETLSERYEDLNLYIVGKAPTQEIIKYNGIKNIIVTGYVDDIDYYIEKCDVCIIPLFIGGGMRVKILESMAKGIPCISTSIGAEGIEVKDKENIMIANSGYDFIKAIENINTNKDLYIKIVNNAHKLIKHKYSEEVIGKKLLDFVNK